MLINSIHKIIKDGKFVHRPHIHPWIYGIIYDKQR